MGFDCAGTVSVRHDGRGSEVQGRALRLGVRAQHAGRTQSLRLRGGIELAPWPKTWLATAFKGFSLEINRKHMSNLTITHFSSFFAFVGCVSFRLLTGNMQHLLTFLLILFVLLVRFPKSGDVWGHEKPFDQVKQPLPICLFRVQGTPFKTGHMYGPKNCRFSLVMLNWSQSIRCGTPRPGAAFEHLDNYWCAVSMGTDGYTKASDFLCAK